ncbi:MAG TPA: MYG1 family protein [Noviherbaspirillum sp.]|nr:MYG1 family protein [Noviherbaspirillum sp.]
MIIATHSGKFHADDVWAVAVLDIVFPGCELIRTRDPALIERADFAVDVGGVWDPAAGRFDHHQKGFDAARASGVVYASAGLVWKAHGARCVARIAEREAGVQLDDERASQIAYAIDADVVQYLDMSDTGAARSAPGGYGLSALISGYNPNWMDEQHAGNAAAAEALRLARFRRAMAVMEDVIVNQVKYRVGSLRALDQVRNGELLEGGRVLFLANAGLPWSGVVRNEMPKVLLVIGYSIGDDRYMLSTVPANPETFEARMDLPAPWAGLREAELAAETGVPDAVFCHNKRFIAAARSFEGALALARIALRDAR